MLLFCTLSEATLPCLRPQLGARGWCHGFHWFRTGSDTRKNETRNVLLSNSFIYIYNYIYIYTYNNTYIVYIYIYIYILIYMYTRTIEVGLTPMFLDGRCCSCLEVSLMLHTLHGTGVGKSPISGILNISFTYLLNIISPIVG